MAGPWLVAYLAVNLAGRQEILASSAVREVYTEVTTLVLKELSAVVVALVLDTSISFAQIFLLVNVLNARELQTSRNASLRTC